MVGLPRLHGELGAKRVEVTVRQKAGEKIERVSLKKRASNNTDHLND
jgi:hypothetical protein